MTYNVRYWTNRVQIEYNKDTQVSVEVTNDTNIDTLKINMG